MDVMLFSYKYGDNQSAAEYTQSMYRWITDRGALVARARIKEECGDDWPHIVKIQMFPTRAWVSNTIYITIVATTKENNPLRRYVARMHLDSDADPNFIADQISIYVRI